MDRGGAFGKGRPQGAPPAAGQGAACGRPPKLSTGQFALRAILPSALMPERNLPCIFGGDMVKCP